MKRKSLRDVALRSFALVVLASAAWQAQGKDAKHHIRPWLRSTNT